MPNGSQCVAQVWPTAVSFKAPSGIGSSARFLSSDRSEWHVGGRRGARGDVEDLMAAVLHLPGGLDAAGLRDDRGGRSKAVGAILLMIRADSSRFKP